MQHHLNEISRCVTAGAHAVLTLDKAGWHTTHKLHVPSNISLLHLPPASPELNPTENIWQYLRQTYLSNRVFGDYEAVVEASGSAWMPVRSPASSSGLLSPLGATHPHRSGGELALIWETISHYSPVLIVISGFPWGVNLRHHPRNGDRQQRVRASRSWCAYSRPSLPLWMLGWGAKMLSCPVLKQFAVLSSRRLQYRSRPSREIKKARIEGSRLGFRAVGQACQSICSKPDLLMGRFMRNRKVARLGARSEPGTKVELSVFWIAMPTIRTDPAR
jgi:DDE superfamily endonuclease